MPCCRQRTKRLSGHDSLSLSCAPALFSPCFSFLLLSLPLLAFCHHITFLFYTHSSGLLLPPSPLSSYISSISVFLCFISPHRRRHRPQLRDPDHKRASSSYRSTPHPGIRAALELHRPCSTCYYPPPPIHPLFDAFILSARRANTVLFSQWLSTAASGAAFLFFCRTAVGFVGAVLLSCPLTWWFLSLLPTAHNLSACSKAIYSSIYSYRLGIILATSSAPSKHFPATVFDFKEKEQLEFNIQHLLLKTKYTRMEKQSMAAVKAPMHEHQGNSSLQNDGEKDEANRKKTGTTRKRTKTGCLSE